MNVNRVFIYSKEVAKKNGNKLPILGLIVSTILLMVSIFVICIIPEFNAVLLYIDIMLFFALIMYFTLIFSFKLRVKLTGFATTADGRIFKVAAINNGQGLYLGGVAAGSLVDQLIGKNSTIGRNLGGVTGAVMQMNAINKSAEYMSHPEIIAKMVECAPNVTGAFVYEILKVYNIEEKNKSYKITCDYKVLNNNKVKLNKKINIDKSFNMYDQLIQLLNTRK